MRKYRYEIMLVLESSQFQRCHDIKDVPHSHKSPPSGKPVGALPLGIKKPLLPPPAGVTPRHILPSVSSVNLHIATVLSTISRFPLFTDLISYNLPDALVH